MMPMISFDEAFRKVLQHSLVLGSESVALLYCPGRILAEDIEADRDFPPFDRSTKDGIAINFEAVKNGIDRFEIQGVLSAGMPRESLSSQKICFEIMTGAVLPKNADCIVMYEQVEIENGHATISKTPKKGQNIHSQGSDAKAGSTLLEKGMRITAATIGVLATVGKTVVLVKKLPKVCVISTGNELVEVSETPLPHQIRKSNTLSLAAALQNVGISPTRLHLVDDREAIERGLQRALDENDVLMLSGGVSKGKFDFVPDALESLGVEKVFHRVAQRPGKPFWFGIWENRRQDNLGPENQRKVVFSFPGNPVSTFANYHVYFLPWLTQSLQNLSKVKGEVEQQDRIDRTTVVLNEPIIPHSTLTLFLQVKTKWNGGILQAQLLQGNGSGDLVSLAKADGFIRVPPGNSEIPKGHRFQFTPCT